MEKLWHWFVQLHPLAQGLFLIGIFSLLITIALNHTAEENLVNLLLAVQTMVISSKMQQKKDQ